MTQRSIIIMSLCRLKASCPPYIEYIVRFGALHIFYWTHLHPRPVDVVVVVPAAAAAAAVVVVVVVVAVVVVVVAAATYWSKVVVILYW